MTTDEAFMDIADKAYRVDPLKQEPPLAKGSRFGAGSGASEKLYEVIDTETNPVNGFQAMAVAPVVEGRADTSQITVSFAGTNPDHRADVLSDVESVVAGHDGWGTQVEDAKRFADRVKRDHPGVSMTTTGHSLGAFLALLIAAENHSRTRSTRSPQAWPRRSAPGSPRWWAGMRNPAFIKTVGKTSPV